MTRQELEDFITQLDRNTMELCVYPHKMTIDCNDCYKCRVDYFNWVRQDMINKYGLTD